MIISIFSVLHSCFIHMLHRACRVTAVGGLGQRFQPKEHSVLILG